MTTMMNASNIMNCCLSGIWMRCRIFRSLRDTGLSSISSMDGWKIIKALTNHATLHSFEPAAIEDIVADD